MNKGPLTPRTITIKDDYNNKRQLY